MELLWHRRDRRPTDLAALRTLDDTILPVVVIDPAVEGRLGSRQRPFVGRALEALRGWYRDRGSDLVIRHGSAVEELEALLEETGADGIRYATGYTPARRAQQDAVEERLEATASCDTVLVPPEALVDPTSSTAAAGAPEDRSPYGTYSQFYRAWQRETKPGPVAPPEPDDLVSWKDDQPVPFLEGDHEDGRERANADDDDEVIADLPLPEATHTAARDRLEAFRTNGLETYANTRDDLPAAVKDPTAAVSRLSPYLAVGLLGIRDVWAVVAEAYVDATGDTERNVEKFGSELAWREWAYHQLFVHPDLETEPYKAIPNEIPWRDDPEALEAWTRGETGYPLVDAGMRQLEAEGYIHNRPRQVVASFLTKHVLLDWRLGEAHFRDRLLDYDPATNPASWQWIASTGTDSVAVRIFDPVSQCSKYDPHGQFVRAYVPELAEVPDEAIVEWPTLPAERRHELAPAYPDPIVGRNEGYGRAKAVLEEALER